MFRKVAIIGLGLMGGSLGMAIRQKIPVIEVWGVEKRQTVIKQAFLKGAIDQGTQDLAQGITNADLIFLAVPLAEMLKICKQMKSDLKLGALVSDLGSVKGNLVPLLEKCLAPEAFFIGGHPMTGSERGGIEAASAALWENAVHILTPTKETHPEKLAILSAFWEKIGVRVVLLTPEKHDQQVALVSHLPHLVANVLLNLLEPEEPFLGAGSWRDLTRIGDSSPDLWLEILSSNKQALLAVIEQFQNKLALYKQCLTNDDLRCLRNLLLEARVNRDKIKTQEIKI